MPLHNSSIRHSGLDKPAPYLIRGNLGAVLAKAGIQLFQNVLGPGFRRGDNKGRFSKVSK